MLNPFVALKKNVRSRHLERIYVSYIVPHLEYGAIIFDSANQGLLGQFDKIHYRAALTVSGCIQGTNTQKVLQCLDWLSLEDRRKEKKMVFMYDYSSDSLPPYLNLVQSYVNPVQDGQLCYVWKFVLLGLG
jgi:hypothetical protein